MGDGAGVSPGDGGGGQVDHDRRVPGRGDRPGECGPRERDPGDREVLGECGGVASDRAGRPGRQPEQPEIQRGGGKRLVAAGVGSVIRLRQTETSDFPAGGQLGKSFPLLFFRTESKYGIHDERTLNADKTANGASFFKAEGVAAGPRRLLKLSLSGHDPSSSARTYDEACLLYFTPGADEGWDAWDASKLTPLTAPFATLAVVGERDGSPHHPSPRRRRASHPGRGRAFADDAR